MKRSTASISTRSHLVHGVALLAATLGLSLPAAATPPARFPITLAEVAVALATQQPTLAATSLEVPPMTATAPDPGLVVEGLRAAGPNTAEVRLACRDTTTCLPFYVQVRGANTGRIRFQSTVPARLPASHASLPQPPAIRSGARAELRIDSGRLHISLPVICLASGSLGGEIRVTSLDHTRIYTARIVSASLLEGSL